MYDKLFQLVKATLEVNEGEASANGKFAFRKRSEHIKRVFRWAERLMEDDPNINRDAVLVAALFHDIGYTNSMNNSKHAENSAILCENYLRENGYEIDFIDQVVYLVKNHSNKYLLSATDTPIELIILMEADLLDETGALSIVWDSMAEGSKEIMSFDKTYSHLLNYSGKILKENPMVTAKAKAFWLDKQKLTKVFIEQLAFDLGNI